MKKLIAFLLAIVMVLILAACAAQKAEQPAVSDAAAEPAADQNQTQEDAAASETPAAQDEPVELEVWVCADSLELQDTNNDGVVEYGMGTEFSEYAARFMETHPNVTINVIPIGANADEYNSKFSMAAAADNLPDIVYTAAGWIKEWAPAGVITDLSGMVDEIAPNFKTDAIEVANAAVDGTWCIPMKAETQGWFYNTKILAEHGLEVPETFEEFLNVCKVLTEDGTLAIAHGATDVWAVWGYYSLFCQNGVDKELCEKLSSGEEDFFTCEPFRKTLEEIKQIADTGAYGENCAYMSNNEARSLFLNGDAAMYGNGSFSINDFASSDVANDVVFSFGPQFADKVYEGTVGMRVYGWSLLCGSRVGKSEAKLAAVKDLFKFITSEEGGAIAFKSGTIPAADPTAAAASSGGTTVETSIFEALASEDVYTVPDMCQEWFDASIKVPFRTAVTAVLSGTATIDQAMQLLADWQSSYVAQ